MKQTAREVAFTRAKGRCERCGAPFNRALWEAHSHHLTYIRRGFELPEDYVIICRACHSREHPQHTFLGKKEQRARAKRRARRTRAEAKTAKKWVHSSQEIKAAKCALRKAAKRFSPPKKFGE